MANQVTPFKKNVLSLQRCRKTRNSHSHARRECQNSLLLTVGGKHFFVYCTTSAARAPVQKWQFHCRGVAKTKNLSATLGQNAKKISSAPSVGIEMYTFCNTSAVRVQKRIGRVTPNSPSGGEGVFIYDTAPGGPSPPLWCGVGVRMQCEFY